MVPAFRPHQLPGQRTSPPTRRPLAGIELLMRIQHLQFADAVPRRVRLTQQTRHTQGPPLAQNGCHLCGIAVAHTVITRRPAKVREFSRPWSEAVAPTFRHEGSPPACEGAPDMAKSSANAHRMHRCLTDSAPIVDLMGRQSMECAAWHHALNRGQQAANSPKAGSEISTYHIVGS